ncbi:hypothetical protein [Streptomyces sp. S4.7]|nr:hypothetical protein [Streptomyces sp. S4.7]
MSDSFKTRPGPRGYVAGTGTRTAACTERAEPAARTDRTREKEWS